MTIVCEDTCNCSGDNVNFLKDPNCSGDYYPTELGMVLQRFCPECGVMKPEVEGRDPNYISNNAKKAVANRIATIHRLGFKETKTIAVSCEGNNKQDFISMFSKQVGIPVFEVASICF